MALKLTTKRSYLGRPEITIQLRSGERHAELRAMIDTGSAISLFDEEVLPSLSLNKTEPDQRTGIVGVEGRIVTTSLWRLQVVAPTVPVATTLLVGFVPRLAKSTGHLLGRDFLESVHFGLDQHERTLYLGRA
jgi:hypothetical protein